MILWLLDKLVEGYALAAAVIYLAAERVLPRPEWLARLLFGCSVQELATDMPTGPAWLESVLSLVARLLTAPLAVALFAVLWLTAFVRIRRAMTPFLLSRAVIGGSGMLDAHLDWFGGWRVRVSGILASQSPAASADSNAATVLRNSRLGSAKHSSAARSLSPARSRAAARSARSSRKAR